MKFLVIFLLVTVSLCSTEPNPPAWPNNVIIVEPGDSQAQEKIDRIYSENGGHQPDNNGQWSSDRYAILFKPGTHDLDVNVGFYTSIIGLGKEPRDTQINTVTCEDGSYCFSVGALDNFWRSAENFYTKPSKSWFGNVCMLWAVSQAAPMRRVYVDGNLCLFQYVDPQHETCSNPGYAAGYASGGFMADCHINGKISSGSQQQWMTRNSYLGSWTDGNWNMVFVGCPNAPKSHCDNKSGRPFTTVSAAPVIAEKPYISFDANANRYYLMIPRLETNKSSDTTDFGNVDQVDFSNVYVATDQDSAAKINLKLANGLHVVLSPGNYMLTESIQVNYPNVCILGIGFPTLIATNPSPCITVGNVDGVRIAGILLQAGTTGIPTLLQWGQPGYKGNKNNPGFLYDCFARVGGPYNPATHPVSADKMVVINSGNVIGDNFWLWRADHTVSGTAYNGVNPCMTGLQVNGDDVTIYGLAVEHTLGNLTEWNGENGYVYFYQSEYPYDVDTSYAGISYKVADKVNNHHAWGVGVYSYFRDHPVQAKAGIQAPNRPGIHFTNSVTVFLNGQGEIRHVINNMGDAVTHVNDQSYFCEY